MSTSANLNDSPNQSDAFIKAQDLPNRLIAASAGKQDDVLRASGLILTKEQLIHVKRYESRGLSLPVERKDVVNYLGYETGAGPNLEAADFQSSFALIRNHAARWNGIRTDLMNVSSELWVFADRMLVYEQAVKKLIDQLSAKSQGGMDPEAKADFLYYIGQILELVRQRHNATTALKAKLDDFGLVLSTQVMPTIDLKLASIRNKITPVKTDHLIADINKRATDLDQIHDRYTALAAASSANATDPLNLGIYADSSLDILRRQLGLLRAEQQSNILGLARKSRINGALHLMRDDLQDLKLIVLDADIATKNLITVWNSLHIFLSESASEGAGINDTLSLRRLMTGFKLVANPWRTIKSNTDLLLQIFKEADNEYRRDYGRA